MLASGSQGKKNINRRIRSGVFPHQVITSNSLSLCCVENMTAAITKQRLKDPPQKVEVLPRISPFGYIFYDCCCWCHWTWVGILLNVFTKACCVSHQLRGHDVFTYYCAAERHSTVLVLLPQLFFCVSNNKASGLFSTCLCENPGKVYRGYSNTGQTLEVKGEEWELLDYSQYLSANAITVVYHENVKSPVLLPFLSSPHVNIVDHFLLENLSIDRSLLYTGGCQQQHLDWVRRKKH